MMMRPSNVRKQLEYTYDSTEKIVTKERRISNIDAFLKAICEDIEENDLSYESHQRQIILYETVHGEKIGVMYPGKESVRKGNSDGIKKNNPYDMKPILYTSDNRLISDQNFLDLYSIIERISKKCGDDIFYSVLAIIFRMGFMVDVEWKEKHDLNGDKDYLISYFDYDFESDIMNYLDSQLENFKVKDIDGNEVEISFVSYMIYYYLLFQQEDNKYYYLKNSTISASGRVSTAKSVILFGGVLKNKCSTANSLQKFISGRGIGTCTDKEITRFTDETIIMTNIMKNICDYCDDADIKYKKKNFKSENGEIKYNVFESLSTAIIYGSSKELVKKLKKSYKYIFDITNTKDKMKIIKHFKF